MDANEFWARQIVKNKSATPKYKVCTEADSPEEAWMRVWIEKWRDQFAYFTNSGCGCCVNFYEFDAPAEAVAEIVKEAIELEIYELK